MLYPNETKSFSEITNCPIDTIVGDSGDATLLPDTLTGCLEPREYVYTYEGAHSPTCFIAGTPVATPAGICDIEELKVGDEVVAYNSLSDLNENHKVIQLTKGKTNELVLVRTGDETVACTPSHRWFVFESGDFQEAKDISRGMHLQTLDGRTAVITSISILNLPVPVAVYNLTVEGCHNFYVGQTGYLVHNKNQHINHMTVLSTSSASDITTAKSGELVLNVRVPTQLILDCEGKTCNVKENLSWSLTSSRHYRFSGIEEYSFTDPHDSELYDSYLEISLPQSSLQPGDVIRGALTSSIYDSSSADDAPSNLVDKTTWNIEIYIKENSYQLIVFMENEYNKREKVAITVSVNATDSSATKPGKPDIPQPEDPETPIP